MQKTILVGLLIGIALLVIEYTFFSNTNTQNNKQDIQIVSNQSAYSSSSNGGNSNISQTNNTQYNNTQNIRITNNQNAYSSSSNGGNSNVTQTNNQSVNINYNYSNR